MTGDVTGDVTGDLISVLIADDHPLVRQGLRAVVDLADDLELVGETGDGAEAVRLARELDPRVVVLDLQMPGLHGIEATRQIVRDRPDSVVLVLTMFEDDDTVFAALAAGAAGYLLKGADAADIVQAVRSAAAGQVVLGASLAGRMRTWFGAGSGSARRPFPELTDRELAILDGVASGRSNGEIGRELFLSGKTVANNVSAILAKLNVAHRGEAIVRAREAGLGRQPPPDR